jgi:glycosyltransferase involved in cell wall biosynthesis
LFRRKRKQWLEEWKRGKQSSEFFYGMMALSQRYHTAFIEGDGNALLQFCLYPLEAILAQRIGIGFSLHIALNHLKELQQADVLISTVDSCGLPLMFFKKLGWISGKVIYISQGLSDRVREYGCERRLSRFYASLLLNADCLVVLSEGAQVGLSDWLRIPRSQIRVLPFGVDCDFWRSTTGLPETEIVSVGSDAGRDYETLLRAVSDLPLHIVSGQALAVEQMHHVRCSTHHSPTDLRDIYSQAKFVVVPLNDADQPSGQSTTLQAMACGKAVILTRTRGFFGESYLISGENCLLVPPQNVEAMKDAIQQLEDNMILRTRLGVNARATVVKYFNERRMTDSISQIIESFLPKECRSQTSN